ncbi:glycosyl transferase group 1 [Bernardetia litoralis DSM 6794]|uniref:Glycosyl transferase group 1 n=1 Tax=Bernardetia litoralis (strain ATCC 23117 / DSM 6794 / NBRC 15988 / NCIMB 1366 / Fx l1 / Sio-4) TaxID=880071 RepID=I4AK01_BERLS|nr:glycosyltransferase [Bernardetia litoralis]AFM04286.1 glycosyl transferase group 1 [Bernardetia litoralis DSM 6794]
MNNKELDNTKKHICFISAGHLSSNPRLIKEATLASKKGYKVSIVAIQTLEKLVPFENQLLKENPSWQTYIYPFYKKKLLYFFGTLFHHLAKQIPNLARYFEYGKMSINTPFWLPFYSLLKNIKADIYSNHNIYLTPLVYQIAKKNKAKFGMDIEDAYSFITAKTIEDGQKNIMEIENKYFPKADYITAASPLYVDFYNKLYQSLPSILPILNVFDDIGEQEIKEYKDRKNTKNLSLYWFSQTTGKGRGIEQIIEALNVIDRNDIELHLRGEVNQETKEYFLTLAKTQNIKENIFFHELVSNQELAKRTTEHDIGLALEIGFSINNELAVSNKIFQYINTGLAILASSTKGQSWLIKKSSKVGFLIDIQNIKQIAQKIEFLADSKKNNTQELENMKMASKNLSKTKYNWTIEGQKFIKIIELIL